ncbi:hypothetical protein GLOIN_2v1782174 [Rhizophagus clarus]|uniref:Uncharacterized protein n=1 Tax=Rhizophagus clarus TaxID=94130 RepID=A0A8H3QYR1_9GLOM|nr:hypothetical protein GLOIN_2v1782174 [Rhizophagus clarus]
MSKPKFSWFKVPLQIYVNNLLKYSNYLIEQKAITLKNQNSLAPIVDEEFKLLTRSLEESPYWEPINISQFCPNERIAMRKEFIDTVELCIGDPELITDLCEINKGRIFKYDLFWVVAISIRDFQNQVLKICPLNISTPSLQWIRLQFGQKTPYIKVACSLLCSILLLKGDAILLRENSWLVFMDDKHQCKVVADYDFTKCDVIPSVTIICDISCTIDESFYKGQVYVGLKDSIIQPSDPLRHIAELYKILKHQDENKPYLLLYTDGGPDHRVTYIHVQMALIAY